MPQSPTETMGTITFLMMQSKFHSGLTIENIRDLCLPPIDAGLAVTASTRVDGDGVPAPLAFALFARVSDEWDAKLRDPDFAITDLPRAAWTSGSHQWLLDLLASHKAAQGFAMKAAQAVFEKGSSLNIRLREKDGTVNVGEKTI